MGFLEFPLAKCETLLYKKVELARMNSPGWMARPNRACLLRWPGIRFLPSSSRFSDLFLEMPSSLARKEIGLEQGGRSMVL